MKQPVFRFGEWTVDVAGNALSQADVRIPLEPRAMDVLRYLCRHPGAVIPAEEILQACWGTPELGDNPIHKAIAQLRRALGDSSTEPRYIETVRKRGYRAIAEVIEEEEQADVWQDGSPFRGLEAFEEHHAAIFFGRVQATARLRETVLRQVENGCAMTLVLGPSGSGKTSLVRAGLLPQLTGGDGPVALTCLLHMDCADLGGGDLFGALAAVLVDAERDGVHLFDGSSAEALGEQLRSDPASVAARLSAGDGPVRIAVFVDRLEAIFRAPNTTSEDRVQFIQLLDLLATERVLVLLACRNDFYPELIALPELMALKARGGHFDLEPPDGADIAQMIRLPARAAGLTFEVDPATGASLDDVLCDEARGSPDALPLLQYCLNELYRQRSEDGVLRFEVFRQLGGIEGALGVRAEQIVSSLTSAQQSALPHVLSLIVIVGELQNTVTARRAAWSALRGDAERELVTVLVEARLFVSELAGNVSGFGVAHEALLRRWPRVVDWIERHQEALQVRTRISYQAERWALSGRQRDLLLPDGIQLVQANNLLELEGFSISSTEAQFIQASASRSRSFKRLRLGLLSALGLMGVLSIALGITAQSKQREAEQHRLAAEGLMTYMLSEFVDKLRPLGRLDLLDGISNRALSYLSASNSRNGDQASLTQRAKTLQVIAEVQIARADPVKATEALRAARSVLLELEEGRGREKGYLMDLGANAYWLGQISLDRGELVQAKQHFSEYLRVAERLFTLDSADPKGWIEKSYAHSSVGSAELSLGAFDAASVHFRKSIELKKSALRASPSNDGLKIDLANGLSWLASTKAKLGDLASALALYQQERALLGPLHDTSQSNALWTYRLAMSHWHIAEIHAALGNITAAKADYVRTGDFLGIVISSDPTNLSWQLDRAKLELKLLAADGSDTVSQRLSKLKNLMAVLSTLREKDSANIELNKLHAIALQQRSEQLLRGGFPADALASIDEALANLEELMEKQHNDVALLNTYANAMLMKARVHRERADRGAAVEICVKVQQTLSPIALNSSDYTLLVPLARSLLCSGDEEKAARIQKRLEEIGYKDPRFIPLNFIH